MSQTDDVTQPDLEIDDETAPTRRIDDRRSEVKPTDNPVPSSPEPEPSAVKDGQDKLDRVKAY